MAVHRVIPPSATRGRETACGIALADYRLEHPPGEWWGAAALDGYQLRISDKGQPMDCTRCYRVLKLRHENAAFNIERNAYDSR